jgi:hypothetical protein
MQHDMLQLPPGKQSFNFPNLTPEHATAREKTYALKISSNEKD